jgi:RNA polymerase sigma-70 factor (ECF subfamily)
LQGIAVLAKEAGSAVNDERSLLAKVDASDKAAFTALYDRHVALVFGICKRILKDPAQAEDVTQSVFTMLWAKPNAFAGGNFAAWIARVARNAALDVVRSASVRLREPEIPQDLVSANDLEDEVFTRVQSSAVARALQALPSDQREAIEQAYFGGLSYREVAQNVGAPLGTIKSRIRSGLRQLWELLQQQVAS